MNLQIRFVPVSSDLEVGVVVVVHIHDLVLVGGRRGGDRLVAQPNPVAAPVRAGIS